MRLVSGLAFLLTALEVGCGGSSMRNDGITGDGVGGTSVLGGSGGSSGVLDCSPQDAQIVGNCQPAPKYAFSGVECIGMSGCTCIGEDCDELVPTPPAPTTNPCELEYAGCYGISRSCDEIAAVYAEYTSRNACSYDAECQVVPGGCAVGLGGCYHVLNHAWRASGVEALIAAWEAAGCMGAVCRCAAPPTSANCVDGRCVAPL